MQNKDWEALEHLSRHTTVSLPLLFFAQYLKTNCSEFCRTPAFIIKLYLHVILWCQYEENTKARFTATQRSF